MVNTFSEIGCFTRGEKFYAIKAFSKVEMRKQQLDHLRPYIKREREILLGDMNIDFVELVEDKDTAEKDITIQKAQMCWFYGIVQSLTVSPMKDEDYKEEDGKRYEVWNRKLYGDTHPKNCFAISTAREEIDNLEADTKKWKPALSTEYLKIFTK